MVNDKEDPTPRELVCPEETPLDEPTTRLVLAAQGGDDGAREALFQRYLPRVRRIVAMKLGRRARDIEDHEDLVQDALVKVLRSLHSYQKYSTARFYHFVSTLVVNLIRDHLRGVPAEAGKHPRRPLKEGDLKTEDLSRAFFGGQDSWTPSRALEMQELEEALEEAVLELPEGDRELYNLHFLCRMSSREIAETLGFEQDVRVRVNLHRVRQKLLKALAKRNVLPESFRSRQ